MTSPKAGDKVEIVTKDETFEGVFIPVPEKEEDFVLLKLDSGYNIGILRKRIQDMRIIEKTTPKTEKAETKISVDERLPTISILHTGGTIASKVDYKTGGVVAKFDAGEMISLFPELSSMANFNSRLVGQIMSEEMRFAHYNIIAKEVLKEIENGADGIIVTHGTDTLHYSAAALGFMLSDLPVPVILVGAQRSSDRGSTDATVNLLSATYFISNSDFSGVGLCMHDSSGDESAWILSPFNSRKMHTSRRDAFRPINRMPVARINYRKKFIAFENKYEQRNKEKKPSAKYFDEHIKVGIIKTHPNMYADEFEAYKSFDGLVVEGTGLGHFPSTKVDDFTAENRRIFHAVEQLIQNNVVVVMAPQTIYGRLQMNVYAPQREIQRIGVLGHLSDMTVETTFIKLAFLLSNYPRDEVKKMMMENLKGELSGRVTFNEFLV